MHPMKLDSNWLAARASSVLDSGEKLTTTNPPASAKAPWMDAVVPGTILTTLLKNKMIPDPFYGMENKNIIDIADSGREYYTFWYFTSFKLSESTDTHAWLQFRAINYQADVFLNGHKESLPKGMFRRHILDITDWTNFNGPNYLAVLVHPPDNPGRIPPEGGQGGDHQIAKDVAAQYVEGWDWMIPIRDRNTGIWDEVSISFTGPVRIFNPHLVNSFFDNYERVYLHTSLELRNTSSKPLNCLLKLQVAIDLDESFYLIENMKEEELLIQAGTTIQHIFAPLFFYKPKLWWPNGMGKQSLYKVDIVVEVQGYGESDAWNHAFGFRKIESFIDPSTQGRMFKVNGEPVFIRGGNWILSDGLLRLSEKRYKTDIDFHADMNMNMIRVWGGGIAERPEFYKNCDRRGLLVWQEFWITGDCNGGSDWPLDHELFLTCARDTVMMLRNHSSLALWVGGNEHVPPSDINDALKKDLQLHPYFQEDTYPMLSKPEPFPPTVDPSTYLDGSRVYIEGSLSDGFGSGGEDFSDGPYEIRHPEEFFQDNFYSYGFNPEVGSVGIPVAATIRAIFPPEAWEPPKFVKQEDGNFQEVANATWEYHNFHAYSSPGKGIRDQIEIYGEPNDLDDYCNKAQLASFIQYQALMEGWNSRMWTKYTGVLVWKNQNPWTGLRGQFYDHLLAQTAGFFGVCSACEPIHVQLNLFTYFIEVVNTTAQPLKNVNVEVNIWDLEGANPYHQAVQQLTLPPKKTMAILEMQYPKSKDAKPVYFLLLKLTDSSGGILSRNLYWLHLPGGDYKQMGGSFKTRKIPVRTRTKGLLTGSTYTLNVEVENLSHQGRLGSQNWPNKESSISNLSENQITVNSNISKPKSLMSHLILNLFTAKERKSACRLEEPANSSVSPGVAFWLHFSVIDETKSPEVDRRILPVKYTQNYFSLVPGEKVSIDISFDYPASGRPKLLLEGWNIEESHVSLT